MRAPCESISSSTSLFFRINLSPLAPAAWPEEATPAAVRLADGLLTVGAGIAALSVFAAGATVIAGPCPPDVAAAPEFGGVTPFAACSVPTGPANIEP